MSAPSGPQPEQSKRCCTCHELKDTSAFNKNRTTPDGLQPRCRDCRLKAYAQNPTRAREQGLRWWHENHDQAIARHRERERWRRSPHEKERARWTVGNQLRRGHLKRGDCELCRKPNAEAHHEDYSKPL